MCTYIMVTPATTLYIGDQGYPGPMGERGEKGDQGLSLHINITLDCKTTP